jgi:predicted nucleic acid-binding protein
MKFFFDTNLLLYADDHDGGSKTTIARGLIREGVRDRTGVVSTQVLQEYFVNARRKLDMGGAAARARVEIYSYLHLIVVDLDLILGAIDLHRLESISFWDALIVRAAQRARCDVLYTEDLQHGRRYEQLQVHNPFLEAGGCR